MAIKLLIDSASDFGYHEALIRGMGYLPMQITFPDGVYKDGIELNHEEFYNKLIESSQLPKTSQISPFDFEAEFEKMTKDGDSVIAIVISSKLSGTYQSALIAAEKFKGKAFVVDSENVCIGQQILIYRALELIENGQSVSEIVKTLESDKKRIRVLALLNTLEYLKKGGRISPSIAFAGELLGIKPVVAIENGEVSLIGKARGSKQANNYLNELVKKNKGINFKMPLMVAYSGNDDSLLRKYIDDSRALWEGMTDELKICSIGSTIGTHVGPGAIALAFFENE